ncbi:MAG: acyl carrier protein [Gemmatimonadota bacterium]|nr:acyl carrier protein [Gemmatimonadota bacterium]
MPVTEAQIITETRAYITENFLYARPDYVVAEDEHLLEKGIVDSMGMVELIAFLQDRFGVDPADDEITEDNFATLRRLAAFVARKLEARGIAA